MQTIWTQFALYLNISEQRRWKENLAKEKAWILYGRGEEFWIKWITCKRNWTNMIYFLDLRAINALNVNLNFPFRGNIGIGRTSNTEHRIQIIVSEYMKKSLVKCEFSRSENTLQKVDEQKREWTVNPCFWNEPYENVPKRNTYTCT